ncbi:MAG: hypothetical protein HQ593_01515 [Candidatus Omnitrophica bacterium]|nr:hypothetical protein [Candidatus Omnitrophota bacterium]
MRLIRIGLFMSISFFIIVSTTYACTGARPLAMGGAFVGVADDANVTYWNPAALPYISKPQITYTGLIHDRDVINYDDWVSLIPFIDDNIEKDVGSFGIFGMFNRDKFSIDTVGSGSVLFNVDEEWEDAWVGLSYGREIIENFSMGVNVRFTQKQYKLKVAVGSLSAGAEDDDSAVGIDLAMYYKWDKFTFGLLVQDLNDPEYKILGSILRYKTNVRPGVAYRPDDKTILSLELYDVGDANNIRFGAERWFFNNYALRLGGYNLNSNTKTSRAVTGGLGIKIPDVNIYETIKIKDLFVDYGLMYWTDMIGDYEDFTHILSITMQF